MPFTIACRTICCPWLLSGQLERCNQVPHAHFELSENPPISEKALTPTPNLSPRKTPGITFLLAFQFQLLRPQRSDSPRRSDRQPRRRRLPVTAVEFTTSARAPDPKAAHKGPTPKQRCSRSRQRH